MSQNPATHFTLLDSSGESPKGRKDNLVPGVIAAIVVFTVLFALVIISFCLVARKRSDPPSVTPLPTREPRPTSTIKRSVLVTPFRRASQGTVSSSRSSQFNPRDSQSTLVPVPIHDYEMDELSLPRPSQAHIRDSQFTHLIPPGLV